MKNTLPYPEDPKEFALWIAQQDAIGDAQIAAGQGRPLKEYMAEPHKKTYA